ncbi:MAG: hypothetical protein HQ510_12145 [Candidatus Marinimicrobia bacterium]|nr:hypothetical protein [Candidatus Neomarinimicrobiota bacterium]
MCLIITTVRDGSQIETMTKFRTLAGMGSPNISHMLVNIENIITSHVIKPKKKGL